MSTEILYGARIAAITKESRSIKLNFATAGPESGLRKAWLETIGP
jgi:hypothetical protein